MTITNTDTPFSVGKFLVSPLSRLTEAGDYIASLSIRSGHGLGTHDRIYRFLPRFSTQQSALAYAVSEGRHLVPQH
jgi:hypothetical protein